jgi:hypothetical protein
MPAPTWGPFTGRQLTTIICVVAVTLLLPVAAWSATASHVIVDAPVAANVAQRSQFIAAGTYKTLNTGGVQLIAPPSGKGLVITTFHFSFWAGSGLTYVHMYVGNNSCVTENFPQEWVLPTAAGSIDAPISPGYVVPPGKALCAHLGGSVSVNANAEGYIVAAGDARNPSVTVEAKPEAGRR